MGKFTYQSGARVDIEDRALAHLQFVITNKLRRGEAFVFTWRDDVSVGDGRTAVWLNPGAMFSFKDCGSRPPSLNRSWLEALALTANAPTGLYLIPEPADRASEPDSALLV